MHQKVCDRLHACSFSECASSPGSAWHSCCCISHWQLALREQLLQLASLKHSCSSLRLHLDESVTVFKTHTQAENTEETISVQLNFIRGVLFCSNCNKLAGIDTKCNKSWEWNQRVKQANRTCRVRREINVRDRLYRDVIFIDVFYILYAVFNSLAQRQLYLCKASKEI